MSGESIEVGCVCVSRAGHDKGCFYMIYRAVDENYVLLVDGVRKTIGSPKKKKVKHIKSTPYVLEDIAKTIAEGKSAYDFQIAKALDDTKKAISAKGKEG